MSEDIIKVIETKAETARKKVDAAVLDQNYYRGQAVALAEVLSLLAEGEKK